MKSFAFIISPLSIKQLKNFWPGLRIVPDFIIDSTLNNLPAFKLSHIKKIQSAKGKEIEGFLIACSSSDADKILSAGHIAERLGSRVIGLNGCASLIADNGFYTIAKNLKIPLTNGDALTAWSVFEAIYRLTKIKNIDLKKSHLAVIGATTPVGNLCARKLSEYVAKITLVSRDSDKLALLKQRILEINPIEVNIEEDAHNAAKNADIVINANNSSEDVFAIEELKPNTIVCDISVSYNASDRAKVRPDITVIKGGLIKLPYSDGLRINIGLPKGVIYASLAETMLLAFAGRFVSYSLGDNINLDKLEEIADLAVQHGFEVWVPEAPVL